MAPTKKGGASATAKRKPKDAVEPIKEGGKPILKDEEENPPNKKIRRSARNAASHDEPSVDAQLSLDNNGAHTNALSSSNTTTKNITIEHCKQCQCFKVRALKVEKEVKGAIPDVEVTINPEKPRRGCFEIRDGNGNIFLSLQNMPRPFTKLKQWDLDSTIADIIEKIK